METSHNGVEILFDGSESEFVVVVSLREILESSFGCVEMILVWVERLLVLDVVEFD